MSVTEKQMIFGILAVIAAVAMLIGALIGRRNARAELGWTKISAKIVYSNLVGHLRDTSADLLYEYFIDGRRFHGKEVRSHEVGWAAPNRARRDVAKYPAGARIEVHVNPKNPSRAVIEAGGDRWFFAVACGFAVVTGLVGAGLIVGVIL